MSDIPIQKMPLFSRNVKIVVFSLFIFVISVGCFWSFQSGKSEEVGRYQFFVKDNNAFAYVYVLDTKTSRLFLRSIFDTKTRRLVRQGFSKGENIFWDFGTVNQPLNPHTEEHIAKQNRWEDAPIVSKAPSWRDKATLVEQAPKDIFDQIASKTYAKPKGFIPDNQPLHAAPKLDAEAGTRKD